MMRRTTPDGHTVRYFIAMTAGEHVLPALEVRTVLTRYPTARAAWRRLQLHNLPMGMNSCPG